MNPSPLISVIIPCFNGEAFIKQTINSVLKQTYKNIEILCLNDGSTDKTEEIIRNFSDSNLHYFAKQNTGVSDTRNQGLRMAKGKYVLFLDADDLLSENFLENSIAFLEKNENFGFSSTDVIKIDGNGNRISDLIWRGVSANLLDEVLNYNMNIVTCPSSYVFRHELLIKNKIQFNVSLSSSADRYFLIELSKFTQGGYLNEGSVMFYRVHKTSMSNNFTIALLKDNLLFQKCVLKISGIPKKLKREFCFKTNYIFAGSFFKLRKFGPSVLYSAKAFYYSPIGFIKQLKK